MTEPGLIVVGSGPAGVSAAERFRRFDSTTRVTIVTDDTELPYARPPLSKQYLRGETDDVALHPSDWYDEHSIRILRGGPAQVIDADAHVIAVDGIIHPYRALVLAGGASPTALPVPGGEHARQLRSLGDASGLRRQCEDAHSAVVIGAGFIGCEAAASLAMRGIAVTVVAPEPVPHRQRLGEEAGTKILEMIERTGARYVGGVHVRRVDTHVVSLDSGATVDGDLVLAATGVRPNSRLAETAGLEIRQMRIVVGADMRTSAADIFAAGDVALAYNGAAERHLAVEHWQDAVDQGAIAGANAAGDVVKWASVPGFWSTIGEETIKYHAWGDGFQQARMLDRGEGFTVWYEAHETTVGVLTCRADADYDLAEKLIEAGEPPPVLV